MARSTEQIQESIKASIAAIDSRIDLKVGPLWDYLIAPIPPQLATIESAIDNLKRYYSPNFSIVATASEARDFAVNFGTGPSTGNFARSTVVYYRNSPPPMGKTYTVPIGSLVMTVDNTLVFRTTQTVTMAGDYAATYFNPSTQRYEMSVIVEAVAPGVNYNIPPDHLKRMQPVISGIDGVIQTSEAKGGTEPENSLEVARRVQDKFKGLERNSIGGIQTKIQEYSPTIAGAVVVVKPTDRIEFRRLTSGPALDVYVQGMDSAQFLEEYLSIGGETSVPILENATVTYVISVTVDGTVLSAGQWIFVPDTSLEYQGSTNASPKITFVTAPSDGSDPVTLEANSLVEISGYRNTLLDGVQTLFSGDNAFFKTDVLVRSFVDLYIVVSLEVRINSGDPDELRDQITAMVLDFIEPIGIGIPQILLPDSLRSLLRTLPEVEAVKVLEFRRKVGSIDTVETIVPLKNQIPRFDQIASNITVRL